MPRGRFKKGQSGNPGGRPKVLADVRDLARQYCTLAIKTLAKIVGDEKQDARARVAAANALLDRGFGKPSQEVKVDNPYPIAVRIITPLTSEHDVIPGA